MSANHIHFLLTLRNQLKLYHWQTKVYSRHIAVDKILEDLDKNIDSFVEIYIGKYGRQKLSSAQATLKLHNLTDTGATNLCKSAAKYMEKQLVKDLVAADSDLINIRDEMMGQMHQLLYLFTLK
jgi:DNA-binding ferritin-like protein